jgi:nitric oxide reductase NorE protein
MPAVETDLHAGWQKPPGIWMFIAFDCGSFALFFMVFMVQRAAQLSLYDASARLLDFRLGLANTLLLITSSWLVALGNAAGRQGDLARTRQLLWAGFSVASGFAVIKGFEYAAKLSAGITAATNEFFTFYFALTGVHLLHYLIGLTTLGYLALRAGRITTPLDRVAYVRWLDGGALFWHMVDLLWVYLFAMLYLIGAR